MIGIHPNSDLNYIFRHLKDYYYGIERNRTQIFVPGF